MTQTKKERRNELLQRIDVCRQSFAKENQSADELNRKALSLLHYLRLLSQIPE